MDSSDNRQTAVMPDELLIDCAGVSTKRHRRIGQGKQMHVAPESQCLRDRASIKGTWPDVREHAVLRNSLIIQDKLNLDVELCVVSGKPLYCPMPDKIKTN